MINNSSNAVDVTNNILLEYKVYNYLTRQYPQIFDIPKKEDIHTIESFRKYIRTTSATIAHKLKFKDNDTYNQLLQSCMDLARLIRTSSVSKPLPLLNIKNYSRLIQALNALLQSYPETNFNDAIKRHIAQLEFIINDNKSIELAEQFKKLLYRLNIEVIKWIETNRTIELSLKEKHDEHLTAIEYYQNKLNESHTSLSQCKQNLVQIIKEVSKIDLLLQSAVHIILMEPKSDVKIPSPLSIESHERLRPKNSVDIKHCSRAFAPLITFTSFSIFNTCITPKSAINTQTKDNTIKHQTPSKDRPF